MEANTTKSVESKSDLHRLMATIVYGLIATLSVASVMGLVYSGQIDLIRESKLDFILFLFITVIGLAARYLFSAYPNGVLSIGVVGAFFLFTLGNDQLTNYLTLAALLFSVGMYGMVRSRNAVRVLMSIELMLNAVNINLIAFARYVDPGDIKGQLFAIFILTVAAAEAAVGLAIVLSIYRNLATVDMEKFNELRW